MVKWILLAIEAWRRSPDGEARHGPLWTVGTDGDGTFRRAKFLFLLAHDLAGESPLYQKLFNLQGMNRSTGPDEITMDADYKHINKRFATLLRHREGILISDTIVNRDSLARFLLKLPSMTPAKVADLIDPSDHQNVPKAVQLLQCVRALKDLDTSAFTPSEHKSHAAFSLLGELFHAFLDPFINLDLSLTQQLTLLSRYAHLACVMYRRHQTSFMTSQLYADTQMCIKNIYFCVAKQQLADPTRPYYIIHNGTDRLERSFCDVRTQDHARNFDALNLSRKLSVSTLISSIYMRHPDLDRGHRRIKMSVKEGPDHTNPASVRGDVVAGNASLSWAWTQGRQEAEDILTRYGICFTAFSELFSMPALDLLRPLGDGKYVSFSGSEAQDRSLPEEPTTGDDNAASEPTAEPSSADFSIDLEDLVASEITDKHTAAGDWVEVVHEDGTHIVYHKASLVRVGFTSRNGRMAIDRTLKYCGVRRDRFRSSDELTGEATNPVMFYTGDVGASLVRCGKEVCLALIEVRTLLLDGKQVSEVQVDSLANASQAITLTGQILGLTPSSDPHDSGITAHAMAETEWTWTGEFLRLSNATAALPETAAGTQSVERLSQFIIGPLPGWAFFPVSPDLLKVRSSAPSNLPGTPLPINNSAKVPATWRWKTESLAQLTEDLWANTSMFSEIAADVIEELPLVEEEEDSRFPYGDDSRKNMFVVKNLPQDLRVQKLAKDTVVDCKLCSKGVKVKNMRNHVGGHLLRAQVGIGEPGLISTIDLVSPCGFCGLDGCSISLTYGHKKRISIRSNCPYHYDFSYNAAITPSVATPSTNVPLHCELCPADERTGAKQTFWKYNLDEHLRSTHLQQPTPSESLLSISINGVRAKHISLREARGLGVDETVMKSYRAAYELPGSDDIAQTTETAGRGLGCRGGGEQSVSGQRKRSGTSSVGGATLPVTKRLR